MAMKYKLLSILSIRISECCGGWHITGSSVFFWSYVNCTRHSYQDL